MTKGMRFHWHRCDECNVEWRHATIERNRIDLHAHMCPKCGCICDLIVTKGKR